MVGKDIMTTAAEGWFPAGGLGRVQQYHAAALAKLAGAGKDATATSRIFTVEPYYPGSDRSWSDPAKYDDGQSSP